MNRLYCHKCCSMMQSIDTTALCPVCDEGFIENIDDIKYESPNHEEIDNSIVETFRIMFIAQTQDDNTENNILLSDLWNAIEMKISDNNYELIRETLNFARDTNITNPADITNLLTHMFNDTIAEYPDITPQGPLPASKKYMQQLRADSFKLKSADLNTLSRGDCIICQDKYRLQIVCVTLSCGHTYHVKCVSRWFKTHNTCPICRSLVPTDNKTYNLLNKLENR